MFARLSRVLLFTLALRSHAEEERRSQQDPVYRGQGSLFNELEHGNLEMALKSIKEDYGETMFTADQMGRYPLHLVLRKSTEGDRGMLTDTAGMLYGCAKSFLQLGMGYPRSSAGSESG